MHIEWLAETYNHEMVILLDECAVIITNKNMSFDKPQLFPEGLWTETMQMQPLIQVESWINEHAAVSLSGCVSGSDEERDCHIVKFCEHLALPLLRALITSHLFLQATACLFVSSPSLYLLFSLYPLLFLPVLFFHRMPARPFPPLSLDLCPLTQLHYTAQAAESPRSTRCAPPSLRRHVILS